MKRIVFSRHAPEQALDSVEEIIRAVFRATQQG